MLGRLLARGRRRNGARRKAPPTSPRGNRCELASPRSPPPELLRELRAIDPLYELHYVGRGWWVTGRWRPNAYRARIAGEIKRARERQPIRSFAAIAVPELAYQGFAPIASFRIQGEPDYRIVADARERDWLYRHQRERTFEARLAECEPDRPDDDVLLDELAYRDRNSRPVLFRGQRHFRYGKSA